MNTNEWWRMRMEDGDVEAAVECDNQVRSVTMEIFMVE
jgi:hypothetical protein